jgi:hypothetical protein
LAESRQGRARDRQESKNFFFVNKKEAKKTLIPLDRAGETATGLD